MKIQLTLVSVTLLSMITFACSPEENNLESDERLADRNSENSDVCAANQCEIETEDYVSTLCFDPGTYSENRYIYTDIDEDGYELNPSVCIRGEWQLVSTNDDLTAHDDLCDGKIGLALEEPIPGFAGEFICSIRGVHNTTHCPIQVNNNVPSCRDIDGCYYPVEFSIRDHICLQNHNKNYPEWVSLN